MKFLVKSAKINALQTLLEVLAEASQISQVKKKL